jgi:hypothetical protein
MKQPPRLLELARAKIRKDARCQGRLEISMETAEQYRDVIEAGVQMPAAIVFHDGRAYWLADGWTRDLAHELAGRQTMLCDVREGTLRDAILYSVGANLRHGVRPTPEDRQKAARTLLADPEWSSWSDAEIHRRTGCSRAVVARLRAELSPAQMAGEKLRAYTTKHGTPATMKTDNLGGAPSVPTGAVAAAAEQNRPRWLREAQEGLERARRALACLGEEFRDALEDVRKLVKRLG